jgi:serine/threonine-protein kinase
MTASPASTDVPSSLGSRIRDYEIWGRLGEGGMSQVWLAKHSVLCIPVIIKTVRSDLQVDSSGSARVLSEAKLMARIPSPRVVRAIDAGVHEGRPYLVQEYVDGIDLAELDKRRRTALGFGLPLWFVCEVMHAACEGLLAAHQTGVIHRDVKPSNLFGSPQTGIRLGDFGIAAAQAQHRSEVSGTVKFMAPEQLRGAQSEPTIDVWGAGATAFDLRYGRAPFFSAKEVLDPDRPPPFPYCKSPVEAHFQHVLASMLSKDPSSRPHSVVEPMRHFETLAEMLRVRNRRGQVVMVDKHTYRIDECVIRLRVGDIAEAAADAIVSSANHLMRMRSGVGDALRRKGGDVIEQEAMADGEQPLGSCIATSAGALAAKNVLHAVSAWNEASCVGRAMQHALLLADELGHRTLAIPALGTGAARVSLETCASAMMTALKLHVTLGGTRLRQLEVILRDAPSLETFREVADDALRGNGELSLPDIGLPAEEVAPRPYSPTCVDASKTGGGHDEG